MFFVLVDRLESLRRSGGNWEPERISPLLPGRQTRGGRAGLWRLRLHPRPTLRFEDSFVLASEAFAICNFRGINVRNDTCEHAARQSSSEWIQFLLCCSQSNCTDLVSRVWRIANDGVASGKGNKAPVQFLQERPFANEPETQLPPLQPFLSHF